MKVAWSSEAQQDLLDIFTHIAQSDPFAATRVVDRLEASTDNLAVFPKIGRLGLVRGTRELIVPGLPYILVYLLETDGIEVARVRHAARSLPSLPDNT